MSKEMTQNLSIKQDGEQKSSGWQIRRYRAGDEVGINDLFQRVFNQERGLREWQWKYLSGPFGYLSFIHLAHVEERIVGQYAGISTHFSCKGREVFAVQPVDNMIDPDYRRGLSSSRMQRAMYEDGERACREAGVALGYGFPNEEAYRVGKKVLGYKDLGSIEVRTRSLTRARHARRLVGRGWISESMAKGHAMVHRRLLRLKGPPLKHVRISEAHRFDERFDRLWNRVCPSFGMLAVRDRRYLTWRYTDKTSAAYTILTLEKGEELLGYTVLGKREGNVRVGLLADILSIPGRGIAERLLLASLDFFLRKGFDLAECWSPEGGPYEEVLRRLFPRRLPKPVRAVVKVLDESMDTRTVLDMSNWHITMGDTDGV